MKRIVLAVLLVVAACNPPLSEHPLSDPSTAKVDAKLVGHWRGTLDKKPVFVHIYGRPNGTIDLTLIGDDGVKGAIVMPFEGFTSDIGGKHYLNLRSRTGKTNAWSSEWDVQPHFIFARYSIDAKGLSLFQMDSSKTKDAIAAGKLKGEVHDDDPVLLDETAKLAAYMALPESEKLFTLFATFQKLPAK